ncbi:unnamed protein product [marine sediment metagenome]|uniref:Uncharacterized protein n=1 Tax=marine sediment metagenome TaxID=412755 RepID=X0YCE4_9ZZZZ
MITGGAWSLYLKPGREKGTGYFFTRLFSREKVAYSLSLSDIPASNVIPATAAGGKDEPQPARSETTIQMGEIPGMLGNTYRVFRCWFVR